MSLLSDRLQCEFESSELNNDSVLLVKQMMFELVPTWILTVKYVPWLGAILGSILVGLSGVVPLLIIPKEEAKSVKERASSGELKALLSFAVGGILGDVFLHSLPEIYAHDVTKNGGRPAVTTGFLVLVGLIIFLVLEELFSVIQKIGEQTEETISNKHESNNNTLLEKRRSITGYLNLLSNTIDNFTHGLSLGGAFLVSLRLGLFTTFAILVHEIPHEVGDFAILLNSGFSRKKAAVCQLITASGGLLGAMAAIVFSGASNSMEARTSWIAPFTTGAFLHIALVKILPELMKEENTFESIKQICSLMLGIAIMASVTQIFE